jgi:tRNA 2-thiouridine synthesizing protein A
MLTSADLMADRTLDTSGLVCPIPILKAKKALAEMPIGAILEILATDPAAPKDFLAFCKATGNSLVESGIRGDIYWFLIQRAT